MTILEKLETCNGGINIEHKLIPKDILTDDEDYHGTHCIKSFFFVFVCADI